MFFLAAAIALLVIKKINKGNAIVNAIVYWAHLPEHTDIKTQGYVGVSRQTLALRWAQHKSDARKGSKLYFHNALRRYGDRIVVETVLEDDEEFCYLVEWGLRSKREIGYNIAVGGECPTIGQTFSQEYRDNVSKRVRGTYHSDESKKERSEFMKGAFAWQNRAAHKSRWAECGCFWNFLEENPSAGYSVLAASFGYGKTDLQTIHKKLKTGWNPHIDEAYQLWLKQYKQKECNESTQTA